MELTIEQAFVEAFVQKRKRERGAFELSKPQTRGKFIDGITQDFFEPRYAERFEQRLATYPRYMNRSKRMEHRKRVM